MKRFLPLSAALLLLAGCTGTTTPCRGIRPIPGIRKTDPLPDAGCLGGCTPGIDLQPCSRHQGLYTVRCCVRNSGVLSTMRMPRAALIPRNLCRCCNSATAFRRHRRTRRRCGNMMTSSMSAASGDSRTSTRNAPGFYNEIGFPVTRAAYESAAALLTARAIQGRAGIMVSEQS